MKKRACAGSLMILISKPEDLRHSIRPELCVFVNALLIGREMLDKEHMTRPRPREHTSALPYPAS